MEDRLGSTGEPPDTDARLVAEALLERSAFAALYRRYVDAIYRYAYHRLGTKEQAEDATSQIFLKALIALPSHKSDRSFRSWLFTIAHNVVTDSYRARRPQEPLDHIYELEDKSASPEDEALHRVQRNELREMLYLLPIDQRHILELRLAGLTSSEIGEVLGKSAGAVKVAQSRSIAWLRKSFCGQHPEETKND